MVGAVPGGGGLNDNILHLDEIKAEIPDDLTDEDNDDIAPLVYQF